MKNIIDTEKLSSQYRELAVDLVKKQLLLTNFINTEQEKDFTEPANCNGFGRKRHFNYQTSKGWPKNPLPIKPACKALKIPESDKITAQVFQNAVCNWRCWYCYVPFNLLSANKEHSSWLSVSDLIEMYLREENPSPIIDLSGGQPDLVPEWVPWMMSELKSRNLEKKIYLWSDDNLSNDYFWRYLTEEEIQVIVNFENYGRVCCFKGFDSDSFSFNTLASPDLFENQFKLMKRFLDLGIDIYGYVTLTTRTKENIGDKIIRFIDKLQNINHFLPLRVVPLEIKLYNTVNSRMDDEKNNSLCYQQEAIKIWNDEISKRYSKQEYSLPITEVPIQRGF